MRACANNISEAISFVHERREKLKNARKLGREQRNAKKSLKKTNCTQWVNPKNLHILTEMGFDKDLSAVALRQADNDINQSVIEVSIFSNFHLQEEFRSNSSLNMIKFLWQIVLLQENVSSLREELAKNIVPDKDMIEHILTMGFDIELVKQALIDNGNDLESAIEKLLKLQSNGTYSDALKAAINVAAAVIDPTNTPSTSRSNLEDEMEVN